MSLLGVIGVLLVVGVLLWALGQVDFIDAKMKKVIYVLVIVFVAIWLIGIFVPEMWSGLNTRVGR
jgi:hypothetical protein